MDRNEEILILFPLIPSDTPFVTAAMQLLGDHKMTPTCEIRERQ